MTSLIRIYFDFEIENHFLIDKTYLPPQPRKILNTIRDFIYQRLKIFNEEANKQPEGYVVIRINPPGLEYNYDAPLGMKMKESISESDYRYCTSKIEDYLASLN